MPEPRLSDAQARSIAQSHGFVNVWDGPIRSGKTLSSLFRWCEYVHKRPAGGVLVVTGRTLDTINRNVFTPLKDSGVFGPVARTVQYTRGATSGTILGHSVEVISGADASSEERLRGLTCAGWYGDELVLLPEQFVDQLIGRCSVPGAMGFGTTNPGAPNHWLKTRYLEQAWRRASGVRAWHFTMDDNPALTPDFVARLKALYTGMWYKRMILGLWVMAEGAVFDGFDTDRHVWSGELPADARWLALGTDYGTTNPFAALLLGLTRHPKTGRPCLLLAREWRYSSRSAGRQLSDSEYSDRVSEWLRTVDLDHGVLGVAPRWEIVDPSAASYRVQRHHDGATTYPGDNSVEDGIRTLASLFARDQLMVHDSCAGLLAELPSYAWDPKAAKMGRDEPIKVDDHSIDAARYAIRTTMVEWYHELGWTGVPASPGEG